MTPRAVLAAGAALFYIAAATLLLFGRASRRIARSREKRDSSTPAQEDLIVRRESMRDREDAVIVCAVLATVFAVAAAAL